MKALIIMIMVSLSCGCSADDKMITLVNQPEVVQPEQPPQMNNQMKITVGDATFTATLVANATTAEFKAMLPMSLNMRDFNNNEKVGSLPGTIASAASNPGTIQVGDIMLYGSNSIVLFYETFSTSYTYTKIGKIDNASGLKAALGTGSVTIKFELNGD